MKTRIQGGGNNLFVNSFPCHVITDKNKKKENENYDNFSDMDFKLPKLYEIVLRIFNVFWSEFIFKDSF